MTVQHDGPQADGSTATTEATPDGPVVLTEVAATKIRSLLEQEGRLDLALRVEVHPGGCSGLRYQLYFDDEQREGDNVAAYSGVNVVVDRKSAPFIKDAVIDFTDTIQKQGFTIENPNATGSCACGDSFH